MQNAAWSDGYVTDATYDSHFFRDLTPDYLRTALLLHGVDLPRRKKNEPLRYLELGYGMGTSLNVHAAAVKGEFWGTDFNPEHTLHATDTAQAAGLTVNLLNLSFAELEAACASGKIPQFDIIALHGIWSWISDENRGHILNIINRNLKMGGAVYVSYNALPGWAPFMPMRDLMAMYAGEVTSAAQNSLAKTQASYAFARQMQTAGAGYFAANPQVAQRLESLEGMSLAYVTQEYFNAHWRPFYFHDVAGAMNMAKCSFVTSTRVLNQMDVNLPPDMVPMLQGAPNVVMRETLRDYALNVQFRADVFVKGLRPLAQREHMERMGKLRFVMACQLEAVQLSIPGPRGELQLKEEVYRPVLATLADKNYAAKNLEELEDHPLLLTMETAVLTEALTILCGAGYAHPACQPTEAQRGHCATLNRVFCERAQLGDGGNVLASPVLGGGVVTSRVEQLFLLSHAQGNADAAEWAEDAYNALTSRGESLQRDGKTLEPDEARTEMATVAQTFARERLPFLTAVQVLPEANTNNKKEKK